MKNERYVIEGAESVFGAWENQAVRQAIADKIGVEKDHLSIEGQQLVEGFGSVVVPIVSKPTQEQGFVLKVPKVGGEKPVEHALKSFVNSGAITEGLWVANSTSNYDEPIKELPLNEQDLYVLPKDFDPDFFFMLLKRLPEGDTYLHKIISGELGVNNAVYREAGKALRSLHDRSINLEDSSIPTWRGRASTHAISGDERFHAIGKIIGDTDWFSDDKKKTLRKKLGEVGKMQYRAGTELVRSHGDNWEGNWWIPEKGNEVILFDPALAYGYRGEDIAFGVGNRLISYLVEANKNSLQAIDSFYEGYGNDETLTEAKKDMWKALSYKMIVNAAFDTHSSSIRKKMVDFADALLQFKIDNPDASFEPQIAVELWKNC